MKDGDHLISALKATQETIYYFAVMSKDIACVKFLDGNLCAVPLDKLYRVWYHLKVGVN